MTKSYTECCRAGTVRIPETCVIRFGENKGQTFQSSYTACADCSSRNPRMVSISTRNAKGGRKTECGGACLNGRVSCDCRCQGRCHGAEKCLCGTPA